jgi:riboflavin synthase
MFTGIVEILGVIKHLQEEGSNLHIMVEAAFAGELQVDQSVAHDGVCLTVTKVGQGEYWVTAIEETLKKTTLGEWELGQSINLERAVRNGDRMDGHLVQGHVDCTALCKSIVDENGSYRIAFEYEPSADRVTIEKGSITVDGISLTVVNSAVNGFEVCIIPYTWDHTQLKFLKVGDQVNLEFDVFGKYVMKYMAAYQRILAAQS